MGTILILYVLTETLLNESVNDFEIFPSGYRIYRNDRFNRIGGGSIIAVKNSHCSNQIHLVQELSDFEVVLVEVTNLHNSRKILLVCCYRPPNDRGFLKNFEQI